MHDLGTLRLSNQQRHSFGSQLWFYRPITWAMKAGRLMLDPNEQ